MKVIFINKGGLKKIGGYRIRSHYQEKVLELEEKHRKVLTQWSESGRCDFEEIIDEEIIDEEIIDEEIIDEVEEEDEEIKDETTIKEDIEEETEEETEEKIKCSFCNRDDFKSERGLKIHLNSCSENPENK